MSPKIKAYSVHLFTASGAVLALLALEAASRLDWATMLFWLVVALFVDGIDGTLARRADVKTNAPLLDGVLMDLIIDYLTYVFIPAFALWKSGLLDPFTGGLACAWICFTSVIYFSDVRMKTADNSFCGFPACWNMVMIAFFAVTPPEWLILLLVLTLSLAMFVPIKFVHPMRTRRWRTLSLSMAVIWIICAIWSSWVGFREPDFVKFALVISSLYLISAGAIQQLTERHATLSAK